MVTASAAPADVHEFRLKIPMPGSTMSSGEKNRSPFISLTFIVIPPGSYTIGSPPRTVTITAPFAICDRELPESIRRFWQQQSTRADAAGTASSQTAASTTDDPAASHLNWNDATQICRWLTRQYRGNDESWQCFTCTLYTSDPSEEKIGVNTGGPSNNKKKKYDKITKIETA